MYQSPNDKAAGPRGGQVPTGCRERGNNERKEVPWGENKLALGFPGGPYVLNGLSDLQAGELRERFGPEWSLQDDADAVVPVSVGRGECNAQLERIRERQEYLMDIERDGDVIRIQGLGFSGALGVTSGARARLTTPVNERGRTASVIENFLRALVAYRLLLGGEGLVMHSAAIVIDGQAHLFYGVSDAGKSTISRMADTAGYEVIGDDLNAVLFDGESARVARLPFTGDHQGSACGPADFPLRAIYHLRQAPDNRVGDMPRSAKLATMLVCSPFVNADPQLLNPLQDCLLRLAARVPVRQLDFTIDRPFAQLRPILE